MAYIFLFLSFLSSPSPLVYIVFISFARGVSLVLHVSLYGFLPLYYLDILFINDIVSLVSIITKLKEHDGVCWGCLLFSIFLIVLLVVIS